MIFILTISRTMSLFIIYYLFILFSKLTGPPKPGSSRKMMGSPRQLENAVPTSRNPHGVWV